MFSFCLYHTTDTASAPSLYTTGQAAKYGHRKKEFMAAYEQYRSTLADPIEGLAVRSRSSFLILPLSCKKTFPDGNTSLLLLYFRGSKMQSWDSPLADERAASTFLPASAPRWDAQSRSSFLIPSSARKKSHSLTGMAFLVPRRGFTLKGINFDSPRAKQQKREAPKGVSRFWCLVGDSNPGHPA